MKVPTISAQIVHLVNNHICDYGWPSQSVHMVGPPSLCIWLALLVCMYGWSFQSV